MICEGETREKTVKLPMGQCFVKGFTHLDVGPKSCREPVYRELVL